MLDRQPSTVTDDHVGWSSYALFDALRDRRSRRFGLGMRLDEPLAFASNRAPVPLTEDEQALLAFAACGITGPALNDLSLGPGRGGSMMSGLAGRTVGSVDAVHTVALFVIDDAAAYMVRRPSELAPEEIRRLIELARRGDYGEAYRRSRVRVRDGRARGPVGPPLNVEINRWARARRARPAFCRSVRRRSPSSTYCSSCSANDTASSCSTSAPATRRRA